MMIGANRPCLAVLLCLLLVLTGQSLAVARVLPGPSGQVALCTGSGPVMVHVDENGEPTAPPHFCPDGALSLLNAVAAPETATQWIGRETRISGRIGGTVNRKRHDPVWRARDPPEAV